MDKLNNSEGVKECDFCGELVIQNGDWYYQASGQNMCESCLEAFLVDEKGERYG